MPDTCDQCGRQYTEDLLAVEFSIDHEKAAQAKTCVVIESVDGRSKAHVFYHTEQDLAGEGMTDTRQDDRPDPDRLTGSHLSVFRAIKEATSGGGTITLAELKGAVSTGRIAPPECHEIADELVEAGYVEEPTDGVLRAKTGAEASA